MEDCKECEYSWDEIKELQAENGELKAERDRLLNEVSRLQSDNERLASLYEAAREEAIKFRTLWEELTEPTGNYSDMPIQVDSEIAKRIKGKLNA